jgi:hypothetical protein
MFAWKKLGVRIMNYVKVTSDYPDDTKYQCELQWLSIENRKEDVPYFES